MPQALVIEDDKIIRQLFCEALESAGFEVLPAPNARTAFQLLETAVPDIAFIDVNLPGESGIDVLRHIKDTPRLGKTRTVVVTANNQAESRAEELGADLFLLKPVSVVEMITLSKRLLEESGGRGAEKTIEPPA